MLKLILAIVALLLCDFGSSDLVNNEKVVPCEDEHLDCGQRVKIGACLGLYHDETGKLSVNQSIARDLLSGCRVSCRNAIAEQRKMEMFDQTQESLLHRFGGTADVLQTALGGRISICDLEHGWTAEARRNLIENTYVAKSTFEMRKMYGAPRYTQVGFQKTRLSPDIWDRIQATHWAIREDSWIREDCPDPGVFACQEVKESPSKDESILTNTTTMMFHPLDQEMVEFLSSKLRPLAEIFAGGQKLIFTNVYGVRRYLKGGKCEGHTDTGHLRVISAIINVAQDVGDHPWPLDILDHDGNRHKVIMRPGDILWYESAMLPHGREEIFQGNYFDNIFVHFMPTWYDVPGGKGGQKLTFTNMYGVRRYLKGGKCVGHIDTGDLRVISAIINVAQDVGDHPSPLDVLDHDGNKHKVIIRPGDIVWYESAKLPHGREEIFRGNYFDNIFVHFKPMWYETATEQEILFPYTHLKGVTKFQ